MRSIMVRMEVHILNPMQTSTKRDEWPPVHQSTAQGCPCSPPLDEHNVASYHFNSSSHGAQHTKPFGTMWPEALLSQSVVVPWPVPIVACSCCTTH